MDMVRAMSELYKSVTARVDFLNARMLSSGVGMFEPKTQTLIREVKKAIILVRYWEDNNCALLSKGEDEEAIEKDDEAAMGLASLIEVTDVYRFQDCFAFVN